MPEKQETVMWQQINNNNNNNRRCYKFSFDINFINFAEFTHVLIEIHQLFDTGGYVEVDEFQ